MRIKDILTEHSRIDRQVYRALEEKGYKFLGAGVDQAAFVEPGTGHILKIFGTQEQGNTGGFSPDQQMFFKWYAFCEANKKNPFLPRFYGHESFVWKDSRSGQDHRYLQIRTERLERLGGIPYHLNYFTDLLEKNLTFANALKIFEKDHAGHAEEVRDYVGENRYQLLMKTIYNVDKIAKTNGWGSDIVGSGNIRQRSDGTPVINDPWVV